MKTLHSLVALALMAIVSLASAAEGLVVVKSPYSVLETMDRFEKVVKERGLTVFSRIDHAAGAAKIGKSLRATEVIIFGNPQGGTPFMECAQRRHRFAPQGADLGGRQCAGLAGL
jgi:uncharacterized protein (DUF302 family)